MYARRLLLITLIISMVLWVAACTAEVTPADSSTEIDRELAKQIEIQIGIQDVIKDGRQKVVVLFRNTSDKTFKGVCNIWLRGADGDVKYYESILIDEIKPKQAAYKIMWIDPLKLYGGKFEAGWVKAQAK